MLEKLEAPGDWIVEGGFAKTPAFASVLAALAPERHVVRAATTAGAAEGAARLAHWGGAQPPAESVAVAPWSTPGLSDYAARWRAAATARLSSRPTPRTAAT